MQLTKLTKQSIKGFTLIELLVVIAIIGLLSTIVAAPIQSARKKAKDTRKLADLRQMQTSLANYANDNGSYPSGTTTAAYNSTLLGILALAPQYIQSLPAGLTSTNLRDKYIYVSYHGVAPGAPATTTYGFHLGTTLEIYNPALDQDDDCWGVVSTSTSGITGNKNGGGCGVFISGDKSAGNGINAAYFGTVTQPVVGSSTATSFTRTGISSLSGGSMSASSTFVFAAYNYIAHPVWPDATSDFQGRGVAEGATSTCATVDQCIYDASDIY